MVLDEPHENDEVITIKGITFLMEKELYEQAKPILIDFVGPAGGFRIASELKQEGSCCC